MEQSIVIFMIEVSQNYRRLDQFLCEQEGSYSRNFWQNLIKNGAVKVNTKQGKSNMAVRVGDQVQVVMPKLESIALEPQDLKLVVVAQEDDYLIINKQAGILTHPTEQDLGEGSLIHTLLWHYPKSFSIKQSIRPGIVQRLDRDTSGLLVVARTDRGLQILADKMQSRAIGKEYVALVCGVPEERRGRIEAPIGRALDGKKMQIGGRMAKEAITEFEVQEVWEVAGEHYSLLRIKLLTGRTHQIRVHLAAIGLNIVGDRTYTKVKVNRVFPDLGRQFLHSFHLSFEFDDELRDYQVGLPADLLAVVHIFDPKYKFS